MAHGMHSKLWHTAREYAGHWMVAGTILAATGVAPEHWFADLLHGVNLPTDALHLWAAGIDLRLVLVGAGVVMIAGDIAWRRKRLRPEAPTPVAMPLAVTNDALQLPDRPSIAVLPFTNLSGDPEQEYFSDGVADDIITELSRDRALFVIARNSSFTYRGRSVDVKLVGRELGVRYVVEGSVRREVGRVRVAAQLIDATTGNHLWAERYDRALEDVFAVQDEIAAAVVSAIVPALDDAEQRRVLRKPPGSLSAWEVYQRGLWHLAQDTQEATAEARRLFIRSAEIDGGFAPALTGLAFTHMRDAIAYGILPWDQAARLIEAAARNALAIDSNNAEGESALAHALSYSDRDAGLVHADRALSLNRNSFWAHAVRGTILVYSGRHAEGREELLIALRLNPRDQKSAFRATSIAGSYYFERNYRAAVETTQRCLLDFPSFHPARRFLVAALGQLGRQVEAEAALHDFERIAPRVLDSMVRHRPPYTRPEDQEHLLEGFRKVGWRG